MSDNLHTAELQAETTSNYPYLDYTISFQNTINQTSPFLEILNDINPDVLDINSFEITASSQPVRASWISSDKTMQFLIEDFIFHQVGFSENPPVGYVSYRIRPKANLAAGDSITNFASISFGHNDPVLTNTARTDIVLPTSISEYSDIQLHLYPNPATDQISIQLGNYPGQSVTIDLFDLYGRRVKELYQGKVTSQQWQYNCDLEGLSSGVYFIVVNGLDGVTKKLIKL